MACIICKEDSRKGTYGHIVAIDSAHTLAHDIAHRRAKDKPNYLQEYTYYYQIEYSYIYSGMKRNFEKYYIEEFMRLSRHSDTLCSVHQYTTRWIE